MRFALRLCLGGVFGLVASSGFAADMVPVRSEVDGKTYRSPVPRAAGNSSMGVRRGRALLGEHGKHRKICYGFRRMISSLGSHIRTCTAIPAKSSGVSITSPDFSPKDTPGSGSSIADRWRMRTFPGRGFRFYSSTDHDQQNGRLGYGTLDLGWAFKSRTFGFGFFAGYHFYSERLTTFGCIQTAAGRLHLRPAGILIGKGYWTKHNMARPPAWV